MYKLLVVDDEKMIRELIKKYAKFEGHEIVEASDGMEAVEICKKDEFDVIIMDVMMPELDGFSACREIRKFSDTPIIMLSARGEEYDRIHGFETGVDDYVVKPFSPKELMMRIEAIMKRNEAKKSNRTKNIVKIDALTIDFDAHKVSIEGKTLDMSPKEHELLFYMVKNQGIALSRETLITNVWGYDYYGDDRTLDTHIKLLRKSLGAYAKHIVTVRGVGYRFEEK